MFGVVQISQKDFNLDMETYLSKRTKSDKPKKSTKETTNTKEFKEEAKDYYQQSFFQRITGYLIGESPSKAPMEDEKSEIEEDKKDLEEFAEKQSKGFLTSFRNWFSVDNNKEVQEESPAMSNDVKEILKIGNKWLAKLPANVMKDFKNSDDYEKYKETLKRYKLVKKS